MNGELTLTCSDCSNKRPTVSDAMRLEAAQKIAADMVSQGLLDLDQVKDGAAKDIALAARYERDGYKIARELESRFQWDCDMQISEVLDGYDYVLDGIYARAEKLWGDENPCKPAFSDGAEVVWRGQPATIWGVYERRPRCYKVRQGDMHPTGYYIVPFEEVSAPAVQGEPA